MPKREPVIVVVEDESPIRRFLWATLTSHGYQLVEAVNGQAGLALVTARQPDLVLLDLGLPDFDL